MFCATVHEARVNVLMAALRNSCISDKSSDPGTNAVDETGAQLRAFNLLGRFGDSAASLFSFGLFVSAVGFLMCGFFTRLGNASSALGKILALVLLLVDDFFVVRYVSWIGHP
jgi:hypothetical protein